MKKSANQLLIGFGNKSIVYQCDNKNASLPISDILNRLDELFKEEDQQINAQIPNGVKTVKIDVTCPFSSEKILSSLIKIGMPIELSVKTLEKVIVEITLFIEKNKTLSTSDIRKIVSEIIRKMEVWSYRYTRKDGHDSRRVEIYNYPVLGKKEVSYATISEVIKTSFEKVIPKEAVAAIPRAHMDYMSEYIIEFINSCDLYYIDYNTLQAMIIELSRQPPHPWLITKSTRDLLMKYDIDAIRSNVKKLNSNETVFEGETYCYSEIIHHSSSLILQKYEWFLGTEDFSSFHILRGILRQYNSIDFIQAFQTTSSSQQLECDLALAGYSIQMFLDLTTEVFGIIQVKSHPCVEIRKKLIQYADIAIDLATKKSANELSALISSEWSKKSAEDVLKIAYRVMKTIFRGSDCKNLPIQDNMFRFVYGESLQINQRTLKKQYICLYVDDNFDTNELLILNSRKFTEYADVILVFSNDPNMSDFLKKANYLTNDEYWFVHLSKMDCLNFIENKNPSKYFYDLLTQSIV